MKIQIIQNTNIPLASEVIAEEPSGESTRTEDSSEGISNIGYDCGTIPSTSGEGCLSQSSHSVLSIVEECEMESLTGLSESPSVPLSPLLVSKHSIASQCDLDLDSRNTIASQCDLDLEEALERQAYGEEYDDDEFQNFSYHHDMSDNDCEDFEDAKG